MPVGKEPGSTTIAGHRFSIEGMAGGMLSLRISLRGGALVDLARTLSKLDGVRVSSGPAIVSRGDCYLVHCPGFKLVLSSPLPADDFAHALLSRAVEPSLALTCELGTLFARLMSSPAPRPERAAPRQPEPETDATARPIWPQTSTLRRAALQPGKTLARKTPLRRKTPLSRGRRRP
jgi:hypothetical protein